MEKSERQALITRIVAELPLRPGDEDEFFHKITQARSLLQSLTAEKREDLREDLAAAYAERMMKAHSEGE